MNTKEMLKRIVVPADALEAQLREVFGDVNVEDGGPVGVANFEADTILKGRVIDIVNDDVIVDVNGYFE